MTRRRLLLLAAAVCLLLLLATPFIVRWAVTPVFVPAVTFENFNRLYEGMSEREIEVILGPADAGMKEMGFICWNGAEGHVSLLPNGLILWHVPNASTWKTTPFRAPRQPQGILAKIRRWCGL